MSVNNSQAVRSFAAFSFPYSSPHSHFVNASFQVCIHSAFSFIPSKKQANAFFAWLLSACLLDSVFVAASLCLMPVILSSLCTCADPHLLFSFTSSFPFLYPFHSHSSNCSPLPQGVRNYLALSALLFCMSAPICLLYFPFQKFLFSTPHPLLASLISYSISYLFTIPFNLFDRFICILLCFQIQQQQQLHHASRFLQISIFDSMISLTR